MDAGLQIELIERENHGPCIARVFGPPARYSLGPELRYLSPTRPTRQQAIEDAEAWAIKTLGQELPVSTAIEVLTYSRPMGDTGRRTTKRAHDPAYGINRPLATRNHWNFE